MLTILCDLYLNVPHNIVVKTVKKNKDIELRLLILSFLNHLFTVYVYF